MCVKVCGREEWEGCTLGDVREVHVCEAVEGKGVECGWGDGTVRWTGVDVCVWMCLCCVCASWVFMCGRRMQGLSVR